MHKAGYGLVLHAGLGPDLIGMIVAVKAVDASLSDVTIDVNVQSGLKYTVKSGDTLGKIAKRFLGDASAYPSIAKASGIDNPDRIDVGQEVTLS